MAGMVSVRASEMTDARDAGVPEARAWGSFYALHYARLIGLAGLVCGELASAEDIVQAAMERAWRSRDSLRDDDRLRPWLDRIVVREAARERRSRLTWLGRLWRMPRADDPQVPGLDIVDRAATGFPDRAAIRIAFDELSAAQRAVVVLHLHEGYSVDETAEALGVPRDTVRSRLRSARERLRRGLEEDAT